MRCATCRYYVGVPEYVSEPTGECRRWAPRPSMELQIETRWPLVKASEFCGEWETAARPEPKDWR